MSIQDALVESLPIYYEIQEHITQYPVEQKTPAILSTLQKKGIVTLALTARSLPMVKRTHEQLQTAGFYFGHTKEFDQEFTIPAEQPALLSHGIIFCGNNNKGQILLKTLGMCGYKPKTVIFVDDQLTYVLEVEKECLLTKIHFVGIRYSKLDPLIAQFDPARAEKQYKELLGKDYSEHRTPAQQKADISARPTLLTAIILPD